MIFSRYRSRDSVVAYYGVEGRNEGCKPDNQRQRYVVVFRVNR